MTITTTKLLPIIHTHTYTYIFFSPTQIKEKKMDIDTDTEWYTDLKKSPLTPPPIVFQIVWPILYILMFISLALYIISHESFETVAKDLGLWLFFIQFALNLSWSPVFFQFQRPCTALVILIALLFVLGWTIYDFGNMNVWSAYLLLPYLLWSIFALYLNMYICIYN